MSTIDEKRVYGDRDGATPVFVASPVGVIEVRVAQDSIGEFGLRKRCHARDVAIDADGTRLAVATDEDVLVCRLESDTADTPDTERRRDLEFDSTRFGPAVAVSYDHDTLLAGRDGTGGDPNASVARYNEAVGEWEPLALRGGPDSQSNSKPDLDADLEVRALDGGLVATATGVYRRHEDALTHAGLSDVTDVSAPGVPLAATADGLYKLGNGWMQCLEERVETVAADPSSDPGRLERAHAIAGLTMYEHHGGEWRRLDRSSVPIAAIGYGEALYAVTENGRFLVGTRPEHSGGNEDGDRNEDEDGDGDENEGTAIQWRSRNLGVGTATGLAVQEGRSR